MTGRGDPRAVVIIPYFGAFGPWFDLFLHSLGRQRSLGLLLVTDERCPALPSNARRVKMSLEELRALASARLGTAVTLPRVRKLCDLRPAFGLVFEEFIGAYEYWAYGDEDVLYGDFDRIVAPRLDARPDLVVPSRTMTTGHMTLVKNARRTNELVMKDAVYPEVLSSCEHWAYDESSWARGSDSSSFTRTVKEAEARGEITVHWGFPKRGDVPWPGRSFVYDGGRIQDNDGNETAYYHWGRFRTRGYPFPSPREAECGFAFDRYGFYDPALGPASRLLRTAAGRAAEAAARCAAKVGRRAAAAGRVEALLRGSPPLRARAGWGLRRKS